MFYNGGFQARQQFEETCYSESATRLILKLFKNKGLLREIPKSKELDDFEKKILKRKLLGGLTKYVQILTYNPMMMIKLQKNAQN